MISVKRMGKKINKYFSDISDEQLKKDLDSSGYDFYKRIDYPVFSGSELFHKDGRPKVFDGNT